MILFMEVDNESGRMIEKLRLAAQCKQFAGRLPNHLQTFSLIVDIPSRIFVKQFVAFPAERNLHVSKRKTAHNLFHSLNNISFDFTTIDSTSDWINFKTEFSSRGLRWINRLALIKTNKFNFTSWWGGKFN